MSYLRRVGGYRRRRSKQTEGFSERTKEPKHNGPSRASCERGRSARLARLGGPSSHARKPPAKKAEGSAKEEAAGAEHAANTSTIAPPPKEAMKARPPPCFSSEITRELRRQDSERGSGHNAARNGAFSVLRVPVRSHEFPTRVPSSAASRLPTSISHAVYGC